MIRAMLASAVLMAALPLTAAAQSADETTQQPPPSQGPMVIERVHSGFMFAPEVKITDFDDKASGLIGGSVGWVADEVFFFGGGGYWMPDQSNNRELGYGGFVMQWFVTNSDRFGLSGKMLFGGGHAEVPVLVTQVVGLPSPRDLDRLTPAQRDDVIRTHTVTTTVGSHQDFLVFEPEVNARFGIAKHVRLSLGAGYRFTGNDWYHGYYYYNGHNGRISGAVGTFAVQIGG
jgi:hypothetical protein